MSYLCIVCAVDIEFNSICSLLNNAKRFIEFDTQVCTGNRGGRNIFVIKAGMRAPEINKRLKYFDGKYSFYKLIVAGLAGALDPSLRVGDVVTHNIINSHKIVTRSVEKINMGKKYNACAVDMETEGILKASSSIGVSASVVRIISDDSNHDLPDFNHALTDDGKLNAWKNAVVMLSSPIASARFILGIRKALNALKQAVDKEMTSDTI